MATFIKVDGKAGAAILTATILAVIAVVDPSLYDPVARFVENVLAAVMGAY